MLEQFIADEYVAKKKVSLSFEKEFELEKKFITVFQNFAAGFRRNIVIVGPALHIESS